jgi:hypothetical protein
MYMQKDLGSTALLVLQHRVQKVRLCQWKNAGYADAANVPCNHCRAMGSAVMQLSSVTWQSMHKQKSNPLLGRMIPKRTTHCPHRQKIFMNLSVLVENILITLLKRNSDSLCACFRSFSSICCEQRFIAVSSKSFMVAPAQMLPEKSQPTHLEKNREEKFQPPMAVRPLHADPEVGCNTSRRIDNKVHVCSPA